MVPESFGDFFLGSAGAGAALVGLLFVAVAVAPEQNLAQGAPIERQVLSGSAFTALVNAFLVSLAALIPESNLGYVAVFFGIFGFLSSLRQTLLLLGYWKSWSKTISHLMLLGAGLIVYGLEIYSSVVLIFDEKATGHIYNLATLILILYGMAMVRAWQLLGGEGSGWKRWLQALRLGSEAAKAEAEKTQDTTIKEKA